MTRTAFARRFVGLAGLCAAAGLSAAPARAQFTLAWDSSASFFIPASSVAPPIVPDNSVRDTFALTGTITNTSGSTIFFGSGDGVTSFAAFRGDATLLTYGNGAWASGPYLAPAFQAWLSQAGGIPDGASFTGTLQEVYTDSSTLPGLYDRDFSLNPGGVRMEIDMHDASGAFQYTCPSVQLTIGGAAVSAPEPGSFALLAASVPLGSVAQRRRRRRRV